MFGGYFMFSIPYDFFEDLERIMKEIIAEQKSRAALGSYEARIKFGGRSAERRKKPNFNIRVQHPIRATKCNKVGFEQRCRRTTEKKYGKKLG